MSVTGFLDELPARLLAKRLELGYSQSRAAKNCGVATKVYQRAENGTPVSSANLKPIVAWVETTGQITATRDQIETELHHAKVAYGAAARDLLRAGKYVTRLEITLERMDTA